MTNGNLIEERAEFSLFMKFFLAVVVAGFLIVAIYSFTPDTELREGRYVVAGVLLLIPLSFWSFLNLRYILTDRSLKAVMPPFSYTVSLDEISDVKIENIGWYVGWGLRIWWRRIAFVSTHHNTVVITKRSGFFRKFIISPKNPEEFMEKIKSVSSV